MPMMFDEGIPQELQDVINELYRTQERVLILYGSTHTGAVRPGPKRMGRIGRIGGKHKTPVLVSNENSRSGDVISCNSILGIRTARKRRGRWIYRHPSYKGDD